MGGLRALPVATAGRRVQGGAAPRACRRMPRPARRHRWRQPAGGCRIDPGRPWQRRCRRTRPEWGESRCPCCSPCSQDPRQPGPGRTARCHANRGRHQVQRACRHGDKQPCVMIGVITPDDRARAGAGPRHQHVDGVGQHHPIVASESRAGLEDTLETQGQGLPLVESSTNASQDRMSRLPPSGSPLLESPIAGGRLLHRRRSVASGDPRSS